VPRILASATNPFIAGLPASLEQDFLWLSQALMAGCLSFWNTKPLQPNLLSSMSSVASLVVIKLVLVFLIAALDDLNLIVRQTREPANDLVVGATVLKLRNQVRNGNPAGREL
jgi:hypothetical protein